VDAVEAGAIDAEQLAPAVRRYRLRPGVGERTLHVRPSGEREHALEAALGLSRDRGDAGGRGFCGGKVVPVAAREVEVGGVPVV
jgi:hypothetical protein